MEEPAISFRHATLKLKWAGELFHNLQTVANAWIKDGQAHAVSVERDPDRHGYVVKMGLEGMPWQIPCLVGDICHNCRNVFDYAWMGLVRATGSNEKKPMPISSNRQGLITTIGQASIGAARAEAERLLGDIIRSHRDFQNGGNVALAELNELSNWQKHNLLIATLNVTEIRNVRIDSTHAMNTSIGRIAVYGNKVQMPIAIEGDLLKFEHDGKPSLDVFFEGPKLVARQTLLPAMVKFHQTALQGLKAFCEAFPSPDNPTFT